MQLVEIIKYKQFSGFTKIRSSQNMPNLASIQRCWWQWTLAARRFGSQRQWEGILVGIFFRTNTHLLVIFAWLTLS